MVKTQSLPEIVMNPAVRHDFVLLFDVKDGNPNGDPDMGNMPRQDPDTLQGLVTDVALKRKIRDWVAVTREEDSSCQIYVRHRGILTDQQKKAYDALGVNGEDSKYSGDARKWMCEHFFDVRMFGAVMSTKKYNSGQVRGPVQLTFARSIDPVYPQDISITRVALTNRDDVKGGSDEDVEARSGQMGRKAYLPYGLYQAHGFFNPSFAEQTGVNAEDLALLWEALENMWTIDRSASRGFMACRGMYVFSHEGKFGNAPAQDLFDLISVQKRADVESPRQFQDYEVNVSSVALEGVTLTRVIG